MIYLLYGQDLDSLNYQLDKIKLENSLGEQIVADFTPDPAFISSNLYTPPMLTDNRLVILENFSDFAKVDFEKIHPQVNVIFLVRGYLKPKISKTDGDFHNLVIIEAKKPAQIFRFLDNLIFAKAAVNLAAILQILKKEDPNFVFQQLCSFLERIILAKQEKFDPRLADWQVIKYKRIANAVNLDKLKAAYKMLLTTEIEVKTSQKELKDALPILILRLTQNFQNP